MSKPKRPFKKHFRVNHSKESSGHPSYIIRKAGDCYDSVGLTHSPITDNRKNIRLRKNPNPKDNRASYRGLSSEETLSKGSPKEEFAVGSL